MAHGEIDYMVVLVPREAAPRVGEGEGKAKAGSYRAVGGHPQPQVKQKKQLNKKTASGKTKLPTSQLRYQPIRVTSIIYIYKVFFFSF